MASQSPEANSGSWNLVDMMVQQARRLQDLTITRSEILWNEQPVRITRSEGHWHSGRRIQEVQHFVVGKGDAYNKAILDPNWVETIHWYEVPINSFGVLHSLLVVRGALLKGYVLEKAMLPPGAVETLSLTHGVHTSYWSDLEKLVDDSHDDGNYRVRHTLRKHEIRPSLTMYDLWKIAVDQGPYNVTTCNCHHMAQRVFNACCNGLHLRVHDLPNEVYIAFAKKAEGLGYDASHLPLAANSASTACRPSMSNLDSASSLSASSARISESIVKILGRKTETIPLVCSCPFSDTNGEDTLKMLLRLEAAGTVILAFNPMRLVATHRLDPAGKTSYQISRMVEMWKGHMVRRKEIERNLKALLLSTHWWWDYYNSVKSSILHSCMEVDRICEELRTDGEPNEHFIDIVCVAGGPISTLEQEALQGILEDTHIQLKAMSIRSCLRKETTMADFQEFEKSEYCSLTCPRPASNRVHTLAAASSANTSRCIDTAHMSEAVSLAQDVESCEEPRFQDIFVNTNTVTESSYDLNVAAGKIAQSVSACVSAYLTGIPNLQGFLSDLHCSTLHFNWGSQDSEQIKALVKLDPSSGVLVMVRLKKTEHAENFGIELLGWKKYTLTLVYEFYRMLPANAAARKLCMARMGEQSAALMDRLTRVSIFGHDVDLDDKNVTTI